MAAVCTNLLFVAAAFDRAAAAQGPACPHHPSQGTMSRPAAADEGTGAETDREKPVRLNYVSTPWKTVLNDLARALEVELVMPDVPPGSFSRVDWRSHSRAEAVRILNRELEPNGYRLLVKRPYLIVLELDSTRPEYRAATVPAAHPHSPSGDPPDLQPPPAERSIDQQPGRIPPRMTMRRFPAVDATTGHPSLYPVRQATYMKQGIAGGEATHFRVKMQRQSAVTVAEQIFRAFRSAATPVQPGPDKAPTFRVSLARPTAPNGKPIGRDAAASAPLKQLEFSIAADQRRNELAVEAPSRVADAVARMIRSFDAAHLRSGDNTRLVTSASDVLGIAQNLRAPLRMLAARQNVQEDARSQQPPAANQAAPSNLDAVIQELRGDVSVEAIEDLGVLIVRGHQNDVDAVTSLIREIEKLGIGAAPEIHLRFLSHVNSEALSDLLNSVFQPLGGRAREPDPSIMPVVRPNAIIVVASKSMMPTILDLTDKLDQPGDPRAEFRVFALRNAAASQVLRLLEGLYEDKGGLAVRIKAVEDVRTNSLVVQGPPRDLDEVTELIRRIDNDESKSVNEMRVFPLKNAVADELADVINTAIRSALSDVFSTRGPGRSPAGGPAAAEQGGAGGAAARGVRMAKSVVLQFLTTDGATERRVRSGILEDIRVTPDARANSLLVTAPEQSMRLMTELIGQLDKPTAMVAEIKVFTLANADATAMARLLEALFQSRAQQQELGIQIAGADDASSNLIPMRFSVDTRTNSILVTAGAEALRIVEAVLLRLDQSDLRQRQNIVYRLKNSPAKDVAEAINQFWSSQSNLAQVDPNLVSAVELLEREVIVVPEPVSNSLLISSTPRYFEEILDLTKQLDEAPPQVVIQALLVEVDLDNDDEFGVELGVQDSVLFNRSAISDIVTVTDTVFDAVTGLPVSSTERLVSQQADPGFAFNNQPLGNNPAINTSTVGGQGLSSFSLGRVNGDLGYGGLVLSAGSESVSVLIRALAARRRIHVLSRPQIRTLDNQQAMIQVGQQVPIVDGINISTTGSSNPVIRQDQAGIILTVTPRISPDEVIVMEVAAEKSAFIPGQGVPLYTDVNTGGVIRSPVKDIITAQTTVSIPNGQTIVLGGMITTLDDVIERKVPWLGDLPVVGHAFRHDIASTRRTELLIFLTPRIVHNTLDSEMIKQVEASRISFCEGCAERVHGPLFAVPEDDAIVVPDQLPMLSPAIDE